MPFADVAGARVHYRDRGDSPHAVVFSHGVLMDHEMFDAQVDALAGEYRCIVWDQRGHGQTVAETSFTYWDSAADLVGVLDHLGIAEAALVGMSQGGFLSLRAALSAPERVRGIAFLDSQAGVEDPAVRPAYDALFEEWTRAGASDDIAAVVASIILGDADATSWIAKWKARPEEQVRRIYETLMGREDLHDRLGEIECPAVVIHGTADAAISIDQARALCDGLPGCVGVVPIEGGGHAVNLTNPAEVTAALTGFLSALWPENARGKLGK